MLVTRGRLTCRQGLDLAHSDIIHLVGGVEVDIPSGAAWISSTVKLYTRVVGGALRSQSILS